MNSLIKVFTFPARKLWNYTKSFNTLLEAPSGIKKSVDKGFNYITKVSGATTGACGVGKGAADAAEALTCQDGVCFIVSCVGITADSLQILASFVPDPNVITLVFSHYAPILGM